MEGSNYPDWLWWKLLIKVDSHLQDKGGFWTWGSHLRSQSAPLPAPATHTMFTPTSVASIFKSRGETEAGTRSDGVLLLAQRLGLRLDYKWKELMITLPLQTRGPELSFLQRKGDYSTSHRGWQSPFPLKACTHFYSEKKF